MRVLITGGAGFIGSHVADRLLARGANVFVIDNFATGRRDNLDPTAPGLTIAEGDIADRDLVERCFAEHQPDLVLHAAASYKDPDDWFGDASTNVVGTANVVRAAENAGARRLIYLQTALCYGLNPRQQPITLDHPLDPKASSYAISKTAGEHYVAQTSLDWVSFRLANAYGPRNLSGPLPTFYSRLTSGKPCFVMDTRRDFIYVQDLVDVIELALDGKGGTGPYHVSSGGDVAIKDLYDAALWALGIESPDPVDVRPRGPDDAYTILLDPSRTEFDFGWAARTPLAEGVRSAIDYYKEHGIAETFTHLRLASE